MYEKKKLIKMGEFNSWSTTVSRSANRIKKKKIDSKHKKLWTAQTFLCTHHKDSITLPIMII